MNSGGFVSANKTGGNQFFMQIKSKVEMAKTFSKEGKGNISGSPRMDQKSVNLNFSSDSPTKVDFINTTNYAPPTSYGNFLIKGSKFGNDQSQVSDANRHSPDLSHYEKIELESPRLSQHVTPIHMAQRVIAEN